MKRIETKILKNTENILANRGIVIRAPMKETETKMLAYDIFSFLYCKCR